MKERGVGGTGKSASALIIKLPRHWECTGNHGNHSRIVEKRNLFFI